MGENEVSPMEVPKETMVTPKRRKKMRKRPNSRKSTPNAQYPRQSEEGIQNKKANVLEYLNQWQTNRAGWKFKKNYESWLTKHCLKKPMLGKGDFKIFLLYAVEMHGTSKKRSIEKAQAIISGKEERMASEEAEESKVEKSTKLKRAKQLLEVLS